MQCHKIPIKTAVLFVVCGFFILNLPACKSKKKLAESTHKETFSVEKPKVYLRHRLLYQTFSGRGSLHIVTKTEDRNLNLHLDMNKDKDLLASIRAMGLLEVIRAYATPDSLFALNRLKKQAYAFGYEEGLKLINAEVPFESLQSLFVGSPLLPVDAKITDAETKDSMMIITQEKGDFIQTTHYEIKTQKLKYLKITSKKRPFILTVRYTDYNKIGEGQPFPFDIDIHIHNKGTKLNGNLSYHQARINYPVRTNFRIPGSYKVIDTLK